MSTRSYTALLVAAATVAGLHRSAAHPPAPEREVAVRKVRPGVDPAHLVVHDGRLYTSGFQAGRVTALDLLTGKKLGVAQLHGYERVAAEEADGEKVPARVINRYCGRSIARAAGKLFVEQGFSDLILVIDPDSMRVIKRLPLGDGLLAAAPDGRTVVCARSGKDEFHLIDAATYKHTTVPYPEGGTGISAVAVSPDGRFVVLGIQRGGQPPGAKAVIDKGNSFLAVYDLARETYAATLYMASSDARSVSEFVHALTYSPDGGMLYAGMFQAATGVRVIDPLRWQIVGDIRFEPNGRNKHFPYTDPLGLVFSRGWLFVANRGNQEVVVIDPVAREPVAWLRFAGGKHDFHRVLTQGDRVYLADQEAVYELNGWALARRLASHGEKDGHPPLEFVLKVRHE